MSKINKKILADTTLYPFEPQRSCGSTQLSDDGEPNFELPHQVPVMPVGFAAPLCSLGTILIGKRASTGKITWAQWLRGLVQISYAHRRASN